MHSELGKIKSIRFGDCGYQNVMVGFKIELGGKGWGCMTDIIGGWGHISEEDLEKPESTYKWTHESRIKEIGEATWKAYQLMKKCKVDSLDKMVGIPIRANFESPCGKLINFEVLEDCL